MLSHAAWGKARIVGTDWAKNYLLDFFAIEHFHASLGEEPPDLLSEKNCQNPWFFAKNEN